MPKFEDDSFWSRVTITDGCWLWTGALNDDGYGNLTRNYRSLKAHRYCYAKWNGVELTPDQKVMHSCDNPACVNPAHLSVGSQRDNMADCARKSRIAHGTRSGKNKLSEQDVRDIRANFLLCRVTQAELARRFGVAGPVIHHIVNGRYWRRLLPAAASPAT